MEPNILLFFLKIYSTVTLAVIFLIFLLVFLQNLSQHADHPPVSCNSFQAL